MTVINQNNEKEFDKCPYCPDQGWYELTDNDGYPIKVQCEFCRCNENSVYNNSAPSVDVAL